jgi:hypothetical protein
MRIAPLLTMVPLALSMLVCCAVSSEHGSSGDAGPGGSESDDAGDASADVADCGPLVWNSAACAACTSQLCCSAEVLCAAIPGCVPLNTCSNACGTDGGCTAACGAEYSNAASNYNAILNCQFDSCAAACAGSP